VNTQPDEWMMERIFLRTEKESAEFDRWCGDLPLREDSTPFHSGPHSIRQFRSALTLAGNPQRILEIGFCLGHSARIFLGLLPKCEVISIDNSKRPQTLEAAELLYKTHGQRFALIHGESSHPGLQILLKDNMAPFDLIFIDGGHETEAVRADVALGVGLDIPFYLFDDFWPHWGPGVLPAIRGFGLVPLASFGTMMLCASPESYSLH
jgi:hypothetical protein